MLRISELFQKEKHLTCHIVRDVMKFMEFVICSAIGITIAIISLGWLSCGYEFWGLLGLFFGGMLFVAGYERYEHKKIDWRTARRNLAMPTNLWSDKRWVCCYWMYFAMMEVTGILGVAIYFMGMVGMIVNIFAGLVVGLFGVGFIAVALVYYKCLEEMINREQYKFQRRARR